MKVTKLELANFRNIENAVFCPGSGVNVIWGDNAQGKTNLLEAIWLFTGAKSFRGARDGDYIRFGSDFAKITLDFYSQDRNQQASILYHTGKEITLNGIRIPAPSGIAGNFTCVVFSPSHLSLIKDGPSLRRRFIDTAVCQLRPSFISLLADYKKALFQRNSLLRDARYHPSLYDTLDVWDERLAQLGSAVISYRRDFIEKITNRACSVYAGISEERESLSISYECSAGDGTKNAFYKKLKEDRAQDMKFGTTSSGPHRDDLSIFLDSIPARNFASQGQQRSCVLALKLAEADILRESCGEYPVVLLDDVMSELDSHRQSYILEKVKGHQVFITCCDPVYFAGEVNAGVFHMKGGSVLPAR